MKGVLVLRYKHIYQQKGKENMSLGGKGCENSQKVNTYKDLGNLIRCSDNTLRRIEKINATLKQEDELRVKLESGEVSINEAYNIIFLKNDSNPVNDHSPKSLSDASSLNSTVDQFEQETKDLEPKFSIRCAKKYQIVYLRPNWNYGNQISWHDRQVEDLSALNINDFTLEKSVTMFIQVPPKFQIPIQELARSWGFEFVTSLSVRMGKYMYSSPYAKQVNEYLLVFEKHGVGAPILPKIELGISEINETEVFSVIENLYRSELPKIAIFTSNRRGWDVYDFDKHSQKMVWQYRTIHVEVKKIA
jgi:N6-adenosine-specific RNA methylase IME4